MVTLSPPKNIILKVLKHSLESKNLPFYGLWGMVMMVNFREAGVVSGKMCHASNLFSTRSMLAADRAWDIDDMNKCWKIILILKKLKTTTFFIFFDKTLRERFHEDDFSITWPYPASVPHISRKLRGLGKLQTQLAQHPSEPPARDERLHG